MDAPDIELDGLRQQFQEQIDFFRAKLNLPTERWDDIQTRANDRAFYVAGAQKADLLSDLRKAVDTAIQGGSIGEFRKAFNQAVNKSGWAGWTGQGTEAGEAWRTRVIYQTNIATSYAAGRWAQLNDPDLAAVRPFWRYIHSDSVLTPRPQHKSWGDSGLTLPRDHPFWRTHFPPNGWNCQCRVTAVRLPRGTDAKTPPEGWDAIDPKTGAPIGIDKGWGYAPGANTATPFRKFIEDKLLAVDAPIGAAMAASLANVLQAETLATWQKLFDATRGTLQAKNDAAMVHTLSPAVIAELKKQGIQVNNAAVWMRDAKLIHALRDTKTARGATLSEDFLRNLPTELNSATPYLDTQDLALVYAIDLGDQLGKVVVRINYNEKVHFDGERQNIVSNFVSTGGVVEIANITKDARYLKLGV